jgi:ATP-dependent DNA helicase DinG
VESLVRDASRSLTSAHLLAPPEKEGKKNAAVTSLLAQVERAGQAFFQSLGAASASSRAAPGRRQLARSDYGALQQEAHAKLDAALEALIGYADAHVGKGEAVALIARRGRDLRSDLRRIVEGAFAVSSEDVDYEDDHDARDPDEAPTSPPRVAWLDVGARSVSLGSSPIELGPMLRKALFDRVPTVICTSATLATGGGSGEGAPPASFHFARARLGAPPDTRELVVSSPFDFASRAVLYLPKDLPEPADPAFDAAAIDRIEALVHITGGGAFVLCTSTRAMRRIHEGLTALPLAKVHSVLMQGEAPKHTLLERFRELEDAVLVATMSFWEGVDVPGRALRLVILDKIPFAVPTDPVVAARAAEVDRNGGNSFAEYSVPSAAITLKQGFGRLLRTQDDRGVVAILDRRIVTKPYGRRLVASLPPAKRVSGLEEVKAFWG